jgi:hypothetical protein
MSFPRFRRRQRYLSEENSRQAIEPSWTEAVSTSGTLNPVEDRLAGVPSPHLNTLTPMGNARANSIPIIRPVMIRRSPLQYAAKDSREFRIRLTNEVRALSKDISAYRCSFGSTVMNMWLKSAGVSTSREFIARVTPCNEAVISPKQTVAFELEITGGIICGTHQFRVHLPLLARAATKLRCPAAYYARPT